MKNKIMLLLLVVLVVLELSACAQQPPTTEEEGFLIGITSFSIETVFSRNAREILKEEITKRGGRYIDDIATDPIARADSIDNFVAQGVDAIILLSGDVTETEESLMAAKEKGIVIGSCDAGFVDAVDIYVSSDNYLIGEQVVGELIKAMGGQGQILQIYNDAGSMDRRRKGGAADIIAQTPGVSIEFQMYYAWPDYYPDVKTKMEALILSDGDNIDGIFGTFDGVSLAALQAVREAGLEYRMPIVGVDGDPEALNEIANPESAFVATVIQSWVDVSVITVNEIFNKLNGAQLSTNQIHVPGILVTKDNVQQIKQDYPDLFQ